MRKQQLLFIFFSLFVFKATAQQFLEPIIGYQVAPKENYVFSQFNIGTQVVLKKNKKNEILLLVMASLPIANKSLDTAYTTNVSLPLLQQVQKTIKPYSYQLAIGNRAILNPYNKKNRFSILTFVGATYQKIKVVNSFDKANYILLNPDKTISKLGAFASFDVEYMTAIKKNNFFIQIGVSSSPIGKKQDNPNSFKFLVPINFNLGYSIKI